MAGIVVRDAVTVGASAEAVWRVMSDIDGEPMYWKGTRSVRNVSRDGCTVAREAEMAFGGRCTQVVTLRPRAEVVTEFTGGMILGTRTLAAREGAGGVVLEAAWDVRLAGPAAPLGAAVAGRIRKGTARALLAMKEEAEGGAGG